MIKEVLLMLEVVDEGRKIFFFKIFILSRFLLMKFNLKDNRGIISKNKGEMILRL